MLDGARVREVAKLDADRNLVDAVRARESTRGAQAAAETHRAPPTPSPLATEDDYFAQAASSNLGKLETTGW